MCLWLKSTGGSTLNVSPSEILPLLYSILSVLSSLSPGATSMQSKKVGVPFIFFRTKCFDIHTKSQEFPEACPTCLPAASPSAVPEHSPPHLSPSPLRLVFLLLLTHPVSLALCSWSVQSTICFRCFPTYVPLEAPHSLSEKHTFVSKYSKTLVICAYLPFQLCVQPCPGAPFPLQPRRALRCFSYWMRLRALYLLDLRPF